MRNSIRKRGMAILMSAFMLFQFLPGQLLGQIMNDKSIVANAASSSAAQNERDLYNYLSGRGYNRAVICGILANYYINNETHHFECSFDLLKQRAAECLDFMNAPMANIFDSREMEKIVFRTILENIPESREGAYDAAKVYAEYLDMFYRHNYCTVSYNMSNLAKDGFWPVYSPDEWLVWPTVPAGISTWFGYSVWHAVNGYEPYHAAIDIGAYGGAPVRAIASGTVVYADEVSGLGKRIVIRHSNGIYSAYNHLQDLSVKENTEVTQNTIIGHVGHTGGVYEDHLDFQIMDCNKAEHIARNEPGGSFWRPNLSGEQEEYRYFNWEYNPDRVNYHTYIDFNQDPSEWINSNNDHLKSIPKTVYSTYVESLDMPNMYGFAVDGNAKGGQLYYDAGVYEVSGVTTYLNVRSGPSTNYACIGQKYNGDIVEITDVSNGIWGYIGNENAWIYLGYARYLHPLELIKKPNAPSLSLNTATDVALNSISTVSWGAVDGADSYNITVYNESGAEVEAQTGITATQTSFTLSDAGTYTVKGVAVNSKYTSDVAEMSAKIVVHPNSLVTFLSEVDGSELNKQSVPYGADAALPETPTKKGFTFIGWDGNYTAVKQDTTIVAKWQRNKYNVNFYNGTGSTLDSQRVLYEDAATEPPAPSMEGYTFQGWDKKFDYIEDNMDIYPIFSWENEDLPVIISDVKAERDSTGYNVSYSLQNAPGQSTQCRLVISLKTAEGKLITYTESNAYNLREESVVTDTIYVPSQEVASIVEINAVRKFSLVIPIAENKSSEVTGEAFTNWSTEEPPADALNVEQRTEYRYLFTILVNVVSCGIVVIFFTSYKPQVIPYIRIPVIWEIITYSLRIFIISAVITIKPITRAYFACRIKISLRSIYNPVGIACICVLTIGDSCLMSTEVTANT